MLNKFLETLKNSYIAERESDYWFHKYHHEKDEKQKDYYYNEYKVTQNRKNELKYLAESYFEKIKANVYDEVRQIDIWKKLSNNKKG